MKESQKIERLLKHFYNTYMKKEVIRQHGIHPWELTGSSNIQFGNGGDQLVAVDRMKERGWIKILNFPRAKRIESFHSIQLTEEGVRHAEDLLKPTFLRQLREVYVATIEGITRGLKK